MENKMENCENKYEKHIKIANDYINEQRKEITEQIIAEFSKNGIKNKEQFVLDSENSILKDGYILLQSLYHTIDIEHCSQLLNDNNFFLNLEDYFKNIVHSEVSHKNYLICKEVRDIVIKYCIEIVKNSTNQNEPKYYDGFEYNDIKIFTLYYVVGGDVTICYGIYKKV